MNSPLLLVIDDEPQIRRFLGISLQSQGYRVIEAGDGREGLMKIGAYDPDLVILDLGLPDMDGKKVLETISHTGKAGKVLVLSVRNDEDEKVAVLDLGAGDYVTKPFGIQELLARVRRMLRDEPPARTPRTTVFETGNFWIDLARREVAIFNEPVHLTPKEYAVLEQLATHPGRVVTQTQLLSKIWGPSHGDDSHYLRVVVGRLRQKLGDNPDNPSLIETESGVGYRFTDNLTEVPQTKSPR
ncbi:MAG: response regulator transcription factor [Marinobacter sp.]|uniref:response regulator transcription factor n=1 Tax=Marinobacter sp. TaxID=50741 RepID=UPI0034A017B7